MSGLSMLLFVCILLVADIEALHLTPPTIAKQAMKKFAAISTSFLLLGSSHVSADSTRTVGDITTSGIIFKDTLKITGLFTCVTACIVLRLYY
jgi:hypothetical protein